MNRNHAIQPVTVQLLGLFTMTRRTYIVIQLCVFVVLITAGIILSGIASHPRGIIDFLVLKPGLAAGSHREWVQGLGIIAWCLFGFTVLIAVGEVCETVFVLRRFKAATTLAILSEEETPLPLVRPTAR